MTVELEVVDGVALITLNRPEVRNAVDLPTAQALAAALDELDPREDIRAGVLTAMLEAPDTFDSALLEFLDRPSA